MESRIRHLHCRVLAAPGVAVPPGLERLARERVGEALGEALDAALGEDPGVYVLRGVRASLSFDVAASPPDRLVATEWGRRLAAAIAQSIASEDEDRVARFADEAEFIARFAADLADGVAWERWFYGAFAELRPLGDRGALRSVLLDNRRRLPAILAWLVRHDALEDVLAALDPRTLAALERRLPEPELVRPLLAAALRVADRLDVTAARSAPDELLEDYLAGTRIVPSWRDRRSLADAVLDAVAFIVRRGDVLLPGPAQMEGARSRVESLLPELDWLDVDRLRAGLHELLAGGLERPARPLRASGAGALLRELGDAVAGGPVALDARQPESFANALRLRAALAGRAPDAAARPEAAAAIAAVLGAIERLARHRAAPEVWTLVAAGDPQGAWRRYAEAGGSPEDLELLAEAAPVVQGFAAGVAGADSVGLAWIRSDLAGALLPVRAALDLRLPALAAAAAGAPAFPALLLTVVLRWGGEVALGTRADAALSAALGFGDPPTAEELARGWAKCSRRTHRRLRADVLRVLEARGLDAAVRTEHLAPLTQSTLGHRQVDRTVGVLALAALRAWTGWLRGFGESSAPFVLEQFVRRPGSVALADGRATVELERRPLDLVLEMAGYLDELDPGSALPRRIGFAFAGG